MEDINEIQIKMVVIKIEQNGKDINENLSNKLINQFDQNKVNLKFKKLIIKIIIHNKLNFLSNLAKFQYFKVLPKKFRYLDIKKNKNQIYQLEYFLVL